MARKQTILEREISNFMKQSTGWIVGPETWGQASFRRGSNSRGAIQRLLCDKCLDPSRTDIVIVTGAKRWRASEGTKNCILYRPTPIGQEVQWLIY